METSPFQVYKDTVYRVFTFTLPVPLLYPSPGITESSVMDLEWHPDMLIPERMITVITGPSQVVIEGLNSCSGTIRRYPLLYVCSNFSRVLPGLHRSVSGFSVRRGFTSDQVSTIISECDATYLFIEHDPSLYEEDTRLIPVVANKIRAFARETGTVIIYSDRMDHFMHHMMRTAHRVYLYAEWGDLIRMRIRRQHLHGRDRSLSARQARLGIFTHPVRREDGARENVPVRDAGPETTYGVQVRQDGSGPTEPL